MKITIDTKSKRISLDEEIKLSELFEFLEEILPGTWKEYVLETKVIIRNGRDQVFGPSPGNPPKPWRLGRVAPAMPPDPIPYKPWKGQDIYYLKTDASGEEIFKCDNKGTVPDLGSENGRWYTNKDEAKI